MKEIIEDFFTPDVFHQDSMDRLKCAMLSLPSESMAEIPVKSGSSNGMYTRQIVIPKDTILVGRIHLFDYVDIMLSGDITVVKNGESVRYTGHNVMHGTAGTQRAGYAHEETHWLTVHNSEITDGEEFYNTMTADNHNDYYKALSTLDFKNILTELGVAEADEFAEMDYTGFTEEQEPNIYFSDSAIHGIGVFASCDIGQGERVCNSFLSGRKTKSGRYQNHSITPNSFNVRDGEHIELFALSDIKKNDEITVNYRNNLHLSHQGIRICQ